MEANALVKGYLIERFQTIIVKGVFSDWTEFKRGGRSIILQII